MCRRGVCAAWVRADPRLPGRRVLAAHPPSTSTSHPVSQSDASAALHSSSSPTSASASQAPRTGRASTLPATHALRARVAPLVVPRRARGAFCMHHMALAGKAAGKDVGMWFEPSGAAGAVRWVSICSFDFLCVLCLEPTALDFYSIYVFTIRPLPFLPASSILLRSVFVTLIHVSSHLINHFVSQPILHIIPTPSSTTHIPHISPPCA
ncbi:hypothetical protein B0H19DRAFT_85211 [Mycena capillaripes]|nr:hypothetical protein B0H19DRAFT_85211 [Mycena capillaripes]